MESSQLTFLEETEENIPDPGSLIEGLRSYGYSLSSAISDLIDNSITAKSKNIWSQRRARDMPGCIRGLRGFSTRAALALTRSLLRLWASARLAMLRVLYRRGLDCERRTHTVV